MSTDYTASKDPLREPKSDDQGLRLELYGNIFRLSGAKFFYMDRENHGFEAIVAPLIEMRLTQNGETVLMEGQARITINGTVISR